MFNASYRVRRPSAYAVSNEEFVNNFIQRLRACYSGHCKVQVQASPTSEPLVRVNTDVCPELRDPVAERSFWEEWFTSLYDRAKLTR